MIRSLVRVAPRVCRASFVASTQSRFVLSRSIHSSALRSSDEANAEPSFDPSTKPTAQVEKIVTDIKELTVAELVQLTKSLETLFGFKGMAMPVGGAAPAAAPAAAAPAAEAKAEPAEKPIVTIKLDKYDAKQKLVIIKEVRTLTGLGIKEAKDLVDGAPKELKKDVKREDALKLVEKFKALGAELTLD